MSGRNYRNGDDRGNGREGCWIFSRATRKRERTKERGERGRLYRRTRIAETRQFVARASVNLLPRSRWLTTVRESREMISLLSDASALIERDKRTKGEGEVHVRSPSTIGETDRLSSSLSPLPIYVAFALPFFFLFHFTALSMRVSRLFLNVAPSRSSRLYPSVYTDRATCVRP